MEQMEFLEKLDVNNGKALNIAELTLTALENELENIDVVSSLEVICDYLNMNNRMFDQNI